jgi:predicted metalloprotease
VRVSAGRAAALVLAVLAPAGCATVVDGRAGPFDAPARQAEEVTIVGAVDGPVDNLTRDALADLEDFWAEQFPRVFGEEFRPLSGGYFSVDPANIDPAQYPQGIGCGKDPREVENNAFYCLAPDQPNSDSISYDRAFLGELGDQFGRFLPALVMAHEFGHAVQGRVGSPPASIATETQADCYAGAWSRWVAEGEAQYSRLRRPELDQLLRGYFQLRDPVGTSPGQEQAHGSFFDRASAFQEGFADGPVACRDNFGPERVFTQGSFRDDDEALTGGNLPYPDVVALVESSLPAVWEQAFGEVFREPFTAPGIQPFDRQAPACAEDRDLDLVYCEDERLVGFDEPELAVPAYELGDFAVATAIALPYGLSVRDQLGLSTEDADAVRSAICLTGWYAAKVFNRQAPGILISPGDIDESVQFLLTYGNSPTVFPDADLTGFQMFDLFRNGFTEGLQTCDVGV